MARDAPEFEAESGHIQFRAVVLDCTDARQLAEFYRQLLGLRYIAGDEAPAEGDQQPVDWLALEFPSDGARLTFQRVDRLARVTWPEGPIPQQLHLDFFVRTLQELNIQHLRALALGAELLRDEADDPHEAIRIYADPAGHTFCIFVLPPDPARS